MPLRQGYYGTGGKAPKMSVKRSASKARAGKKAKAARKAMKGGPGPEGFTRV